MTRLTTIGFDADDTLWHNERFFQLTQAHFAQLLADYAERDHLAERLLAAERRNLGHYGYGIKGFVLSMVETALEVTQHRVPGTVIAQILEAGQEMLAHPIELLPHARETVESLADSHKIVLITKGDLLHQEQKIARSGLGDLFHGVEIVSEKTPDIYSEIFSRHGDGPERGLMAGNSMKSDVLPMIGAGGWGVFVPHDLEWAVEKAERPEDHHKFHEINHLGALPDLIEKIGS